MNPKTVIAGTIVWAMGLLVPAFYHLALLHLAIQEEGYSYSFQIMARCFFDLPWLVWPYVVAMAIVGSRLVLSGISGKARG